MMLLVFPVAVIAQEEQEKLEVVPDLILFTDTIPDVEKVIIADTLVTESPDSLTQAVLIAAETDFREIKPNKTAFKPNPNRAMLYGLVPGMGQLYNRKYWKLPIVYGAFMGCAYAVTWNQMQYSDYATAYKDYVTDQLAYQQTGKLPDNLHDSWQIFIPVGSSAESALKDTSFKENRIKRGKDYYRRYRDLSIIISVGVYLISILDAYVDAQLFDFDISQDLSMRVEPAVTPKTRYTPQAYGVNCSFKF